VDEQVAADQGQARTTILTMPAEMDHYSSARIHEDVLAALEPGVSTVIMDLTRTTHCDTAGLGKIALARRLATSRHIGLRIVIPPVQPGAHGPRPDRARPGAGHLRHAGCGAPRRIIGTGNIRRVTGRQPVSGTAGPVCGLGRSAAWAG